MAAVATRTACRALLHATGSSTTASRLVVLRVPCHSHILSRRRLHATPSSSSAAPPLTAESTISDETTAAEADVTHEEDIDKLNDENADVEDGFTADPRLFRSLKGKINPATLKALTVRPLTLKSMTPVQARVAELLPALVQPWDPEGLVQTGIPSQLPVDGKPPAVDTPRDIVVRARTGTGKTYAYLIPAIESRISHIRHHMKLVAIKAGQGFSSNCEGEAKREYKRSTVGTLIIVPTRELAIQVARQALVLSTHHKGFEVITLVGGREKARQLQNWEEGSKDIVVGTPGRLRDLLTNAPEVRKAFKNCPMLILDEADRQLWLGFRDDIDAIVSFLPRPPVRQTFLFSATMPRNMRQLASHILGRNYAFLDLTPPLDPKSDDGEELTTHDHVAQYRISCPTPADQLPTLLKLLVHDQLVHGGKSRVIVFCPTVQMTELFSAVLRMAAEDVVSDWSAKVLTIHSKMEQSERDETRLSFRKTQERTGKQTVLVTSDISARGMDYSGVTRVIQIGVPGKEETYVHRIGRLARGIGAFASDAKDKANFRGDMLLLPWETGYMDWKLTTLPIKPLEISALDQELASLSPKSSSVTTEFWTSALADLRDHLNPVGIRSTAASLLGFYLPLAHSLRLQPDDIVAGVSSWTSQCFNVSIPTIKRLPKRFTDAYERSAKPEMRGMYVDGVRMEPPPLGKAKSRNRSVWEGLDEPKRKPKRWY